VSLLEQQNVLARLLTDPGFREKFLSEPISRGDEFDLSEAEIEDILKLASGDLGLFAESLVWKRLREAEKLLPVTSRLAGNDFRTAFFEFAPTFSPRSIKKHYEDAIAFSQFIENRDGSEWVRDAARFERTRLAFFNERRILAFCRSQYHLGQSENMSGPDSVPARRKRTKIAVWLRSGKRIFHFFI
jgi:hypothetical protein